MVIKIGQLELPLNNTFTSQDYAALDWSSDQNHWVDVNATHRLPYVVEFDNISEPAPIQTPINGILENIGDTRKISG